MSHFKNVKKLLKNENQFVVFERTTSKTFSTNILFDTFFVFIFMVLPIILNLIPSLIETTNRSDIYIVNFVMLAIAYPVGLLIYWRHDKIALIKNGSFSFFAGVFLLQLVIPIVKIILEEAIANRNTIETIYFVIGDIIKILILIAVFKFSSAFRKDFMYAFKKRIINLIILSILSIGLLYIGIPLFEYFHTLAKGSMLPSLEAQIKSSIDSMNNNVYWMIISTVIIAPIFYEIVYRYSIMVLMKTEIMKLFAPTMYFVIALLIINPIENQFDSFLYYFWQSLILTLVLYFKRSPLYSIIPYNLSNLISSLRLIL